MHFDDLSPYSYSPGEPRALNIGWLDLSAPYPQGKVDSALIEKLGILVSNPVNRERGMHDCPFCLRRPNMHGHRCAIGGKVLTLGSAEIRVKANNGTVFAAPDMIYHYVMDHHYLPPQLFLDALAEA